MYPTMNNDETAPDSDVYRYTEASDLSAAEKLWEDCRSLAIDNPGKKCVSELTVENLTIDGQRCDVVLTAAIHPIGGDSK